MNSFIEAQPSPNCNGDYAEVFDGKKLIELEKKYIFMQYNDYFKE